MGAAAAGSISEMEDDIVALLALDADVRGLFPPGALNKQMWSTMINPPDVLSGEHWLLAYEANQQHWLSSQAVARDPDFLAMSQAGVRFYDPSRNIPQFPPGARGFPGGSLPYYYA